MTAKETPGSTLAPSNGRVPVPDPTVLTTAQLNAAILNTREILEAKIDGHADLFDARGVRLDAAFLGLERDFLSIPGLIDKEVATLRELSDEKFNGVEKQFKERDTRIDEGAKANQIKVDAAFAAAKEAVGEQNKSYKEATAKSETSFDKRMDQLNDTMKTSAATSDAKIDDLKQRLTRVESNWTSIASVVAMFLAIAAIVVPLLTNHTQPFVYQAPSPQPLPAVPLQPVPR